MSIDILQEKIRKLKNPSVIGFDVKPSQIPAFLGEGVSAAEAYARFCTELLQGLKGVVPAVRFSFGAFTLLGSDGLARMGEVLKLASELGFYVLLDLPEMHSPLAAERIADMLGSDAWTWPCDGVIIDSYLGTDILRPFTAACKRTNIDVFVLARTSNKSAPEIQDLMTGSRLVHSAVADIVSRQGEQMTGKFGYSQIAVVAAAGSVDSLRNLRSKYKRIFLLLDGYDYPNANAKNCSYAFDKLGHGAAACAAVSVTAAWMDSQSESCDYVAAAVQAAERMKKNLTRYTTVL